MFNRDHLELLEHRVNLGHLDHLEHLAVLDNPEQKEQEYVDFLIKK